MCGYLKPRYLSARTSLQTETMILYIDRYHLSDVLFLRAVAQSLGMRAGKDPFIIVHGSGEEVERKFEAEALFPDRTGGILRPRGPLEVQLFERGMRDTARKLVGLLTDSIVPSVAVAGQDRGLMSRDDGGQLRVNAAGWFSELLDQGVVPVVSAMAAGDTPADLAEIQPALILGSMVQAFSVDGVAFFSTQGVRVQDGPVERSAKLDDVREEVPEAEVAEGLIGSGVVVRLITPTDLRERAPSEWTQISTATAAGNP